MNLIENFLKLKLNQMMPINIFNQILNIPCYTKDLDMPQEDLKMYSQPKDQTCLFKLLLS